MSVSCTDHKTAILLFARTARNEALEKRFLPSGRRSDNFLVADTLLEQTRQTLSQSECPTIISYDTDQRGAGFNERLANSIEDVFALGYEKVIAVGSDTPLLTADHLNHSVRQLEDHDIVIGPSSDGGVYLLGFTRKAFNKKYFLQLPWLTASLQQYLVYYANQLGNRFSFLEALTDVDNAGDLLRLLQVLSPQTFLYRFLISLIQSGSEVSPDHSVPISLRDLQKSLGRRGPPAEA
ncbi:MAG: TIGR04282 family arsenosugar biosynthesis glycosyltransferase [Owenweeksia sp.]